MSPDEFTAMRAAMGVSQSDLARALGLGSGNRVSEYERGTENPSKSVIVLYHLYAAHPSILRRVLSVPDCLLTK